MLLVPSIDSRFFTEVFRPAVTFFAVGSACGVVAFIMLVCGAMKPELRIGLVGEWNGLAELVGFG